MATENRKSFVFYFDWLESISILSDKEIVKLLKALVTYAQSGEVLNLEGMSYMAFEIMSKQIDRDNEKYHKRAERSRINGSMGGRPNKKNETQQVILNPKNPMGYLKPKKPDTVTVTDTVTDTVTVTVTDNNNIYTSKSSSKNETDKGIYNEVIIYLNSKADTNYRTSSKKTRSLIKARISEGYTLDDFKTVIDKKCTEWRGTEYEKFLRPETLFGTKFEGYLNCPVPRKIEYGSSGIRLEEIEDRDELDELFSL